MPTWNKRWRMMARWQGWKIEIVATDLSANAIARARAGTYSQFEVQRGLPIAQMLRWFTELGAGETVLGQTERFEPDPDHRGLYRPAAASGAAAAPARRVA